MSEEKIHEDRSPYFAANREPAITLADHILAAGKSSDVRMTAEIQRLASMGRRRTEIAALLRCPYRVVDAALDDA
jgi:hypothetical protein